MFTRRLLAIRTVLLLGAALLFLTASNPLAESAVTGPTITISPTSGLPGTSVTISGSGFDNSAMGFIYWDSIPVMTGPSLGTFTTNSNGAIDPAVTVAIPAGATPGAHQIWACTNCMLPMQRKADAATFTVAALQIPTFTPEPTLCDPTGAPGEVVLDFEDLARETALLNTQLPGGVIPRHDRPYVIATTLAHSPGSALINYPPGGEFGSAGSPLEFEFMYVQDFVGVFVGVQGEEGHTFTATLTAWSDLRGGTPVPVGSASAELGPGSERIERCLAVEAPGEITRITINYGPDASVGEPEFIDDLVLRGPEEPVPVAADVSGPQVTINDPEDGAAIYEEHVAFEGEIWETRYIERVEAWLDGALVKTLGAARLDTGRYWFKDFLEGGDTLLCGEHTLTVKAYDDAGNEGSDTASFTYVGAGDLRIWLVEPVQTLYAAPLVMGKNTAFRVTIYSSYACAVDVNFSLELSPDQWFTEYTPGVEYPEIWGPVHIPASPETQMVMLPYIEPGTEEYAYDAFHNPAGIIRGMRTADGLTPDVRAAPRPQVSSVRFDVEVDPEGLIPESDEGNNRYEGGWRPVISTRPWRLLFVPTLIEDGHCAPLLASVETTAKAELEYLLATYPIADGKIFYEIMPATSTEDCAGEASCGWGAVWEAADDRGSFLTEAWSLAVENGMDFGVAVDCGGGGGAVGGYAGGVFIGQNSGLITLAHEFNHAITGIWDIYSLDCLVGWDEAYCEHADGGREYFCRSDLWDCAEGCVRDNCWLTAEGELACAEITKTCTESCGCSIYRSDAPLGEANPCQETDEAGDYVLGTCDAACCKALSQASCADGTVYNGPDGRIYHPASSGFWVNRWIKAEGNNYFMDIPGAGGFPDYWMRLENTTQHCFGISFNDGYLNMLLSPSFANPDDPEGLLVSGMIARQGSASFNPFIRLPETTLDLQPGADGEYAIFLLDGNGQPLASFGFTLSFFQTDPNGGPLDEAPFTFRIAWDPATASIELRDPNAVVLARRVVTANTPTVRLQSPNGGETYAVGETVRIRWNGEDSDGDALSFSLSISQDGGGTWLPLATGLADTSFTISTAALAPGQEYLIRVRASDGVNTAEDVSDEVFSIGEARAAPVPILLTVGLIVLSLMGTALVAMGILMAVRRRRAQGGG